MDKKEKILYWINRYIDEYKELEKNSNEWVRDYCEGVKTVSEFLKKVVEETLWVRAFIEN